MNRLFIFGLGYSARSIGHLLLKAGWDVSGTVRSETKPGSLKEEGFTPVLFSDKASIEAALKTATHCLVSIPPDEKGDPVLEAYRDASLEARSLRWVGYLSTIGVYGGLDGEWADENTPAGGAGVRGAGRIEAELAWEALCRERKLPLDIFRLAGIYGPERSPFDRFRAGTARRIVKPGQVFNRIHVADIARTVAAAMLQDHGKPETRIFNVADDLPAPPQDVIEYAAKLIGAPLPPEIPFEKTDLSPMARSFYEGNKRIRNDKIKQVLGVSLEYPTYREGLRALVHVEKGTIGKP
ncbi:MAG: SDR family oxidoreductase [Rhodomicrobium sp.]